jgi:3-oxoacyl-[acyl-carrier protein] reductase
MTECLNEAVKTSILQKIPMARMGEASDVANAALFLAATESGYITGHTVHVNGGMLMY